LSFRFRGVIALCLDHGYCHSSELLIDGIAALRRGLSFLEEVPEASRISALNHSEARFVTHVVGNLRFGRAVVEVKGWLALDQASRVKAIERPDAGIHGQFLLRCPLSHVVTVSNTVAVSDDERWAGVGLSLQEGLGGLQHFGAKGHSCHINVAVHVREKAQILLADWLSCCGKLGGRSEWSRLRLLTSGVGVDLGIEDKNVDIAPSRQHVVEPTVADIVSPAISANEPNTLLHQVIG